MKRLFFLMIVMSLLLAACGSGQPAPDVDDIVQATFQALTAQAPAAPQATPTAPAATTGGISGKLSYPSSGIPPLLVVAYSVDSDNYYWVQTAQDQSTYQMDGLQPGAYHVVAYALPDGKLAGRYDQFYLCGLNQSCTDTNWVDVQVQAGAVTPDVDPGNWYIGEEYYPPMPSFDAAQTSGSGIYSEPMPAGGSISGQLSYPSSGIPPMVVVAFEVGGGYYQYVLTLENVSNYVIEDLPPGSYYVVAYPQGALSIPGGYTAAVPCGLLASCTDHSLIPVTVTSNTETTGINPGDFYAPDGTFPASPLP